MTTTLGKASTNKKTFSRITAVEIDINASAERIWAILTNSSNYPKWNSTVTSIEGVISKGGSLKLKSTLDPKRTFKLRIKEFQPPTTLAWGDAMGTRVYKITSVNTSKSHFEMTEKIGGPIFPLFASKIPSFDTSFELFASDLKKAAESKK